MEDKIKRKTQRLRFFKKEKVSTKSALDDTQYYINDPLFLYSVQTISVNQVSYAFKSWSTKSQGHLSRELAVTEWRKMIQKSNY